MDYVQWISSYITGRKQYVLVDGCKSKWIFVHSGVPQGSHLGPLIFNLFINDIVDTFEYSKNLLYADDLKIFKEVNCEQDCQQLQSDLNSLHEWCLRNKLELNIKKCHVMTFYRKRLPILFDYSLNNDSVLRVTQMTDLGVLFDHKLTFEKHINVIATKANNILGFVKRITKDFKNIKCIKTLYCSLVRSILEYGSVVWSPSYNIHSNRLESVQKKFTVYMMIKMGAFYFDPTIPNWLNLPSYSERAKTCELQTLEERRDMASACFGADLLTARIDSPNILSSINILVPKRALRSTAPLKIDQHRTNYGMYEPVNVIHQNFNDYYHNFDYNISKLTFKQNIKLNIP